MTPSRLSLFVQLKRTVGSDGQARKAGSPHSIFERRAVSPATQARGRRRSAATLSRIDRRRIAKTKKRRGSKLSILKRAYGISPSPRLQNITERAICLLSIAA